MELVVKLAGKYHSQWLAVSPWPSLFWKRLVVLAEERLLVPLRIEDGYHLGSKTNAHKLDRSFELAVRQEVLVFCCS
jgi:hypothetical protein